MSLNGRWRVKLRYSAIVAYLFLILFSFYLLISSQTGEASTVWEVLHPAFIPTLFVATSLLIVILLTSEKVHLKIALIIAHSILIHSLFVIIFPAGDLSGQQMVLGRTRLVYDNAVLHGWPPWPVNGIAARTYEFFRGENFQAGLSVVFARMFSIDLLWVHLFLVPVLWGVFTPIAAYMTGYFLTRNSKVAVLAAVVVSAFPYMTYFGAISVPNSLGYIFFFFSLCFMLKNFESNDSRTKLLMLTFSFMSFVAHYLAGVMVFSLLLLAITFKSQVNEKASSTMSKASLLIAFIVAISLLPLALLNLKYFRPSTETSITLDKLYELPPKEIIGLFTLGELIYGFDIQTILVIIIGPLIAFAWMIYSLYRLRKNPANGYKVRVKFLFAAFLVMLADYRILKILMSGLPLNAERLWVFEEFIASPFVALAIFSVFSSLISHLKLKRVAETSISSLRTITAAKRLSILGIVSALNVALPLAMGGWITFSLNAAYPRIAPLQTTWYELDAVKYIDATTPERYVVVCDVWITFAGERIVGLNNPRAFYFLENDKLGFDLFTHMKENPSPQYMLSAMDQTNTTVAYFIVSEPRLPNGEFADIVAKASQSSLQVYATFGNGRLYVFSYGR